MTAQATTLAKQVLSQAELIEIIRQYRKTIDEQNEITRNPQGEEILQDDKPVENEEVVL